MISAELANQLLRYCPDTGFLYWRFRPESMFKTQRASRIWNKRWANKRAFTALDHYGYYVGAVFNEYYRAHRLIWLMITGDWPNKIDHINHVRNDNRWDNLRSVTNTDNNRNMSISKRNKSGRTGVYWHKRLKKWFASICVDRNTIHLGWFDTFDAACEMRSIAERNYLFHENHGE